MKSLTTKQFHWDRLPASHFRIDRLKANPTLEADTNLTEARYREHFQKSAGLLSNRRFTWR